MRTIITSLSPSFCLTPLAHPLATSVRNASLIYGYLVLLCVLALYLYFWRAVGRKRTVLALATGAMLGHLSASSESWFAALASALLVDIAARIIFSRRVTREDVLRFAAATFALVVTALTSPGILFARLFGGAEGGLGLQFKGTRLLYIPSGIYGAEEWAPVVETDFVWALLLMLIVLPLALLYVWRTGDRLSWLLLLFSGACFSAFFLFTFQVAGDMWRFVQAGFASLGFLLALSAVWYFTKLRSRAPLVRHAAFAAIACATLACVGGYVSYSLALPWLADPRPPVTHRLDVER